MQGIERSDISELEAAITVEPGPATGQPFAGRVAGWLGEMVSKAASGAWNVGTSAAGEILTAALKAYYGLP